MSVNVLSCFPAEPRPRRDEKERITDRRAFRLCIADCDRNRLLDASKWPDSVTVSEWYRIPPSEAAKRRRRVDGRTESVRTAEVLTQPDTTTSTGFLVPPAVPLPFRAVHLHRHWWIFILQTCMQTRTQSSTSTMPL